MVERSPPSSPLVGSADGELRHTRSREFMTSEEFMRAMDESPNGRLSMATSSVDLSMPPTLPSKPSEVPVDEGNVFSDNEDNYPIDSTLHSDSALSRDTLPGAVVDEHHSKYVLMYDMLTGIRIAVSRCQGQPGRAVEAFSREDYDECVHLAFDATGTEFTPSSKYEFKFKDYAPWVFRSLREAFHIDTADYLVG